MIVVVTPEPAPWLAPLLDVVRGRGRTMVFTPWAVRLVAQALARGWSRGRADRLMSTRFAIRRAIDGMAARWLPADVELVVAPTLAARQLFVAARKRGALCWLVEDLPSFRELHDDLDRAAVLLPGRPFLRRYRAPATWVAQQEVERTLADRLLVRGRFAREQREAQGFAGLLDLPWPPPVPTPDPDRPAPRPRPRANPARTILLAGLGAARNGAVEALALARARPGLTLLVRKGEGAEPELLTQPNARPATVDERERLVGVDAVIAPTWCESYPGEVSLAASLGLPIVATRRALGFVSATAGVREIAPGDAAALIASIDAATP